MKGLVFALCLLAAAAVARADSLNCRKVGYCYLPGDANGVAVAGGYAYVTTEYAGLHIVDVSDPHGSHEEGYYDTPGGACGVAVSGSYAYVSDRESGLPVVNVSNPRQPFQSWHVPTDNACGVAAAGSYAYVAD